MTERIEVDRAVLQDLIAHARAEAPLECCGLLAGTPERIVRSVRARNLWESTSRYRIDPGDHFAAIRAARAAGLEVVGAYHSHPSSSAIPSARDLAESNDSSFLHLIVSLAEPEGAVRAYRLTPRNFHEVTLVPIP
ncbi:MAG: M67 family metallopeptidase [Acidobacteria bacterium]|nr:M67 family metallopeptidase [Acidobacteriota bacterium]